MKTPNIKNRARRVKATFMWPLAAVLTFVLCAFVVTTYFLEVQVRDRALGERIAAVSKLFEQKLNKDANLMQGVLRTLMTRPAVAVALQRQDRGALLREVGGLFETLRKDHRITHLYFNTPDLVNVLRMHSPGHFGDVITRDTSIRSRKQGQAVHGIELGPLGTLTLRLVAPWLADGKLLGYLEIGEEIEYLVEEIHDSLLVDVMVLVDKRFLSAGQWKRGLDLLQRKGNWMRFDNQVLVAQTDPQLPAALNDAMLQELRNGRTEVFDDGSRVLHLAMLPLVDAGSRRIGDMVVMRDITQLQQTFLNSVLGVTLLSLLLGAGVLVLFYVALDRVERDYQHKHDLEHQLLHLDSEHERILQIEKLSALGTMVGEIAHQLNNPLVGVVNLVQLVEREADDPVRTRELLKEIHRAGADCHAFIQSMLRFSKVASFESRPTLMAQVIEETVLLFRQTEGRQRLVNTVLPEHAVMLTVDPILIRHALFNLLLNAAQASAQEAIIEIRLDSAVRDDDGMPGWRLSVIDHGKGIEPAILKKIFLPFFTTRKEGTGLGLPVVQHVALLHGGSVQVFSQLGNGTQFAVWLPDSPQFPAPTQPQVY